jgi:hypothetical protein
VSDGVGDENKGCDLRDGVGGGFEEGGGDESDGRGFLYLFGVVFFLGDLDGEFCGGGNFSD